MFADIDMLNTVFRNLITNAIKFSNENGRIDIHADQNENDIVISIVDTGVGILKEKVQQLFCIANHDSTIGTKGETGTGLGLLLCKELIEKHGGKIWVESVIGKGSCFKFTLLNEKK